MPQLEKAHMQQDPEQPKQNKTHNPRQGQKILLFGPHFEQSAGYLLVELFESNNLLDFLVYCHV